MKTRKSRNEKLENRIALHMDANLDGYVTAADALKVINNISDEPVVYSNLDVNGSGKVTALDALNIINHLNRPAAPRITYQLGNITTFGLSRDQVMWAINEAFYDYEKVGNVDMQLVSSNGNLVISSRELHLGDGRTHARGQVNAYNGRQIWFHNGHLSPGQYENRPGRPNNIHRNWPGLWNGNPESLKKILRHEMGHAFPFAFRHTSNASCVMNINASAADFCFAEISAIKNRFPY